MKFGSSRPPRHVIGAPGTPQVWRYRGVDIEVRPYRRGRGTVWVPDPSGSMELPQADPQDAIGHARFWIDADEWTGAWRDPERTTLVHRLVGLSGRFETRARFGYAVAWQCRSSRQPYGWAEFLGPVECMVFDDMPLAERIELLDQVWAERERTLRGLMHERRIRNPSSGKNGRRVKVTESTPSDTSKKRKKNSDGDAFIMGEPIVYGPLVDSPKYMLAWSLETTPACNGPRDTRPEDRRGALLAQLETSEIVDLDCDNFSPVRRIVTDDEQMSEIVRGATPALRLELCRHYYGPDLKGGVCAQVTNPAEIHQIKSRLLSLYPE